MYKHISFDVWNTLLYPNPVFNKKRLKSISEMFKIPHELVVASYSFTKKYVDYSAAHHKRAFTTDEVYDIFCNNICSAFIENKETIRAETERLFLEYPPLVIVPVKETLIRLRNAGIRMSIASNSNFISGKIMGPFLDDAIEKLFDFKIFSDLEKKVKPSQEFYDIIIRNAAFPVENILHIGDDSICDGEAERYGLGVRLIENPHKLKEAIIWDSR